MPNKHPFNPYIFDALQRYPKILENIIQSWQAEGSDFFWLLYSANYLFRVGGVRFAIDPITLPSRLGYEIPPGIAADLAPLQMIALSHDHSDHVHWGILQTLSETVKQWVIPIWMKQEFLSHIPSPTGEVNFVQPGDNLEFKNIQIQVFPGNHWEDITDTQSKCIRRKGLPCLAYLLEAVGKRWLFPGDTRSFQRDAVIDCGKLDGLVAHVFLGRLSNPEETPPLVNAFCNYFSAYQTDQLILTHLYEVGRDSKDIWTSDHANLIVDEFKKRAALIPLRAALTGDYVQW